MGGTEESIKKEEKHEEEEEEQIKDNKKDKKCKDEEKAEKKKKKEKNPEDKKDPQKLKLKLEKLDAKMQALVSKRDEILKLLNEAEQIAKDSIPAQPPADASAWALSLESEMELDNNLTISSMSS